MWGGLEHGRRLTPRDAAPGERRPAGRAHRPARRPGRPAGAAPRLRDRPGHRVGAQRRRTRRLGRGRGGAAVRAGPVRARPRLVGRAGGHGGGARRGRSAGHRPGLLRLFRVRRPHRRQRAGRARGGRRPPRRTGLGDDDQRGRAHDAARDRTGRRTGPAERRDVLRRRDERRRLGAGRGRGGTPDQRRRPGEGRAGAGPGRHCRRGRRRALAAAPPGRELPDVLDVPRRRAVRRDPRNAGAPRARPGHLARARRDDPTYRGRRAGPGPGRDTRAVVEGPRGARVRRPLGRRRAGAALHVDERAGGAVRAAPAQRHAPRDRRRGRHARDRRRGVVAHARRGAAPLGRCRRHPDQGGPGADHGDRGHGPRPLRGTGGLDGRRRRRRVGHRAALGRGGRRAGAAVRGLRHRRRLRPGGGAGGGAGEVRAGPGRGGGSLPLPRGASAAATPWCAVGTAVGNGPLGNPLPTTELVGRTPPCECRPHPREAKCPCL